ncbi:hypothetical protein LLEC1_06603 [Akanthomyces lecanii]|uniref:Aminoglycoside phosphotransferase domain-containing protein n=1 Tax=Cordyceps confragosa TaxID=2714763 RepID=A0A179IAB1_CORDF|nr:hypothetical protein LLEC1_06603 [Akanthomyces lecanii]
MVSLTQLPFALPEDKVPTPQIAGDIIATFLTQEWPKQDPATITVTYSTSFTNPSCFLDARTLEPEDVEDEALRADLARGLATFHTLQAGALPRRPVSSYYEAVGKGLRSLHGSDKLKTLARDGGVPIDELVDYDLAGRCAIVVEALQKLDAKTGWCIHDIQSMNILVKNRPAADETKITLIDFEFVFENYRAFDIGGHFMQKMFKWYDETSKVANCRPYLEAEERHFCEAYAAQWNARTGGGTDTGEQVYREAQLGYMLATAFDIHNMLCWMEQESDKDPLSLAGLNKLFAEFKGRYEKLGLEVANKTYRS